MQKIFKDIKSEFSPRKAIAILLLVACIVFISFNYTAFLKTVRYLNGGEYDSTIPSIDIAGPTQSVEGNKTVKQKITSRTNRISRVAVLFDNPARYKATGTVRLYVTDEKGKTVASVETPANMVAHQRITFFSFNGDNELINANGVISKKNYNPKKEGVIIEKGATYYICVQTKDVHSPKNFDLYGCKDGNNIFSLVLYLTFTYKVFIFFIGCLIMLMLFILVPWQHVFKRYNNRLILKLFFAATPFVSFFTIFKISDKRIMEIVQYMFQLNGLINLFIIFVLLWLFLTITNRFGLSAILTQVAVFIFGFVNYLLLIFRDTPLLYNDLFLWRTAADVASSYSIVFNKHCIWAIFVSVCWIALIISQKDEKAFGSWKGRLVPVAISICLLGGTYSIFESNFLENHKIFFSSFRPKRSYNNHGYILGFALTIKNSSINQPEDYDVEKLKAYTKDYKSDKKEKADSPKETSPNIIVVMNEAFSDLAVLGELKTDKDYMPYFRAMKEDTIRGTMHTSVFGGHTANTEFEYLTGDTIRFFPENSVPYMTMVRSKKPSLAWNLKSLGYSGNIAFHPGTEVSYNRNVAYPNLGFSKHLYMDDVKNPEKIRAYISDKSDYDLVKQEFENTRKKSKAPFFMFNVTIQNHGNYAIGDGIVEPTAIHITDPELQQEQAGQYLNLIKISDTAFKDFIDYFKAIDEPTVVVMFGDHQPRVEEEFYTAILGKPDSKLSLEETERKYRVPFVIWANYDIEEEENVEISTNYLAAYMKKKIGAKMTGYDKYLYDLHEKIPVLTNICYKDKAGNIYGRDSKSKLTEDVNMYEKIQYNAMFDKNHKLNTFFYFD